MNKPSFTTGYENLSLTDRLMRVVNAPRTSFEAVRDDPTTQDWLLPVMLMCLVWIGSNYVTLSVTSDPGLPAMQERLEGLTEEERQQALQNLDTWREHGWMTLPLVNGFSTVVCVGLVMLAVGRWILRADVTLRQMLTLKGYAAVIVAIEHVVSTPLMLFAQKPFVHLGPGAFVGKEAAGTFFGQLLIGINLFDLWQVYVIGTGLSVMAQVPANRALGMVLFLWVFWLALGAAVPEPPGPLPPAPEAPAE